MTQEELIQKLRKKTNEIRNLTLDMCTKAGTGHVTSSFSCAELLTVLYFGGIMKYDPQNPKLDDRDRFILSKGQASPILYAVLADAGFYPKEWLDTFCQKDGKFGVHLQNDIPGVEMTTGSLGHGLGAAVGRALAAKMDKKTHFIFCMLGDGELYEGSNWEYMMLASHYKLNNLIVIVDRNWQCATAFTENCVALDPIDEKFKAFGWETKRINGHSINEILDSLSGFKSHKRNKPYVIIADTIKGKGSPYIESKVLWHAMAPKGEDIDIVKREINLPENC